MKLTRERALELHREMWSDMQKELGDNPRDTSRYAFKEKWCKEHFPNEKILAHCFLCEYTVDKSGETADCDRCPILWGSEKEKSRYYCSSFDTDYATDPISVILALPERDI